MAHVAVKRTIAPTDEPLTPAAAKKWLRIDADMTFDDDLIEELVTECREKFETITSLQLLPATWELTADGFPGTVPDEETGGVFEDDYIRPPHPPLREVNGIAYKDEDGTWTTLDSSTYVVDTVSWPGRIAPADGEAWPDTLRTEPNVVRVTYSAGYDFVADVPQEIKGIIRKVLGLIYESRVITKDTATLDAAIEAICRPYYMAHLF